MQQLFRATANAWCTAYKVDLTGESNAGRGPVDFKLVSSWEGRALIEAKLANNSKFWDGLTVQTPTYQKAEGVGLAFFVAVAFTDQDLQRARTERVQLAAERAGAAHGTTIRAVIIDARRKQSASKLSSDTTTEGQPRRRRPKKAQPRTA